MKKDSASQRSNRSDLFGPVSGRENGTFRKKASLFQISNDDSNSVGFKKSGFITPQKAWPTGSSCLAENIFVFYNENEISEGVRIMNCPFCGEIMEEGTFCDRGGSYFLPAGETRPTLWTKRILEKKHAVLLPPEAFGAPFEPQPAAFWCRKCKKLLVDYTELPPVEE